MDRKQDNASALDLANGYMFDESTRQYVCLYCNTKYEDGVVYPFGSCLAEARKATALHVEESHGGAFAALLALAKRDTGLTDVQKDLLLRFYSGAADKDIAAATGLSPSTLRYQRYSFREKAKQAKTILALSALLEGRLAKGVPFPEKDDNTDDRLDAFFSSTTPLVLKTMAVKRKNQLFILETISRQFETGRSYSEPEINDILRLIYGDYVGLRRALIDAGLMVRAKDGTAYRLQKQDEPRANTH